MRKIIMTTLLLMLTFTFAAAQKQAEIKFDKKSHNFGKFSEQNSVQRAVVLFNVMAVVCGDKLYSDFF